MNGWDPPLCSPLTDLYQHPNTTRLRRHSRELRMSQLLQKALPRRHNLFTDQHCPPARLSNTQLAHIASSHGAQPGFVDLFGPDLAMALPKAFDPTTTDSRRDQLRTALLTAITNNLPTCPLLSYQTDHTTWSGILPGGAVFCLACRSGEMLVKTLYFHDAGLGIEDPESRRASVAMKVAEVHGATYDNAGRLIPPPTGHSVVVNDEERRNIEFCRLDEWPPSVTARRPENTRSRFHAKTRGRWRV